MKKQLTDSQFRAATKGLDVGAQTLEIAKGVLVDGLKQAHFVEKFSLTKGAVSQAVDRVWLVHKKQSVPAGYEFVQALLPERQAYIVRKWADDAAKKLSRGNEENGKTEDEKSGGGGQ